MVRAGLVQRSTQVLNSESSCNNLGVFIFFGWSDKEESHTMAGRWHEPENGKNLPSRRARIQDIKREGAELSVVYFRVILAHTCLCNRQQCTDSCCSCFLVSGMGSSLENYLDHTSWGCSDEKHIVSDARGRQRSSAATPTTSMGNTYTQDR